MISFLNGTLSAVTVGSIIINVNGIGFEVFAPARTIDSMPPVGSEVTVYTFLSVKEDDLSLYGFTDRDELDIFKLLITVNGVGPKAAMSIISSIPADTLRFAILSDDAKTLSKAPGIGIKTAKKITLELKDKMSITKDAGPVGGSSQGLPLSGDSDELNEAKTDAVEALGALGYPLAESLKAVAQSAAPGMESEDILKEALKHL